MITLCIDEKKLERCSHMEIRKRKDKVVLVEVPKGKTIRELQSNNDVGITGC